MDSSYVAAQTCPLHTNSISFVKWPYNEFGQTESWPACLSLTTLASPWMATRLSVTSRRFEGTWKNGTRIYPPPPPQSWPPGSARSPERGGCRRALRRLHRVQCAYALAFHQRCHLPSAPIILQDLARY